MTPQATPPPEPAPSDASQFTIEELLNQGRASDQDSAAENVRLRAEIGRMGERQSEVMKLLNCQSPERILHDLRNVINELNLYRTLMEATEE